MSFETKQKYTLGEAAAVGVVASIVAPVVIALIALLSTPFSLWRSWVFVQLWAWFVVPYFHLPPVSTWLVFGLFTLISLIRADYTVKKNPDETNWKSSLVLSTIGPAISLFAGYLVHHYALHGR